MLVRCIAIMLCVLQINGAGRGKDFFLDLLEKTYKFEHVDTNFDAGDPLLLTPYIARNQTEEARAAARVDPDVFHSDVESYAGYLTVNEECNANLWFWYFPVPGKPVQETPWIIWLQGGPGVSSLYGLFTEIGPFVITEDENVEKRKYSWGESHSLLFIDNPVGTGFSFLDDERGFATNQTTVGENLYAALQQFLTIFPELRTAPLTIAGESYAGKYIPAIGMQIHWHKNDGEPINLHGLAIGNGFIDPPTLSNYSDFVRDIGLLDDKQAEEMSEIEETMKTLIARDEMLWANAYFGALLNYFEINSQLQWYNIYNYLDDTIHDSIGTEPFVRFVQKEEVKRALHVGNTMFGLRGTDVYGHLNEDIMRGVRPWLEELLDNYRVMIYNGHLDIIVGYQPSVHTYKALNFSGAAEYKNAERHAWLHDGLVAGYYKIGGNLTEVMVRGAGHMVPSDKPAAALGLISAFARGISLANDTSSLVNVKWGVY